MRKNRWWILATVAIAQLMVVLDGTIVNIALPAAQADLGFTDANRQWVVTAYGLAFGSLLLLCGRLNDRFGRRRGFLVGLTGFAAASALGGLAPTFGVLVAARALQGAFGALLAPAALSILTVTFQQAAERGRAFGVYGAVAGGGGAIGLLLGGVLTGTLSWRWCLYVNIVFAAIAAIGALLLVDRDAPRGAEPVDWPGIALVITGLFAVVFAFSRAETTGLTSIWTLGSLAVGGLLLLGFAFVERRATHPLLPSSIVLDRVRGTSYLVMMLAAVGMYGVYLFLAYYLQRTLGMSPTLAGVAFLPLAASVAVASSLSSSTLLPLLGRKIVVPTGALLAAAGFVMLTGIGPVGNYFGAVAPGLLAAGLGLGTLFSCAMSSATVGVRADQSGIASATVNTAQQVGGSVGIAVLSSISAAATDSAIASYHAVFWSAAITLVAAAVVSAILYPRHTTPSPVSDETK
jgi:EmrB/QacA subfamily drug resistance transporter